MVSPKEVDQLAVKGAEDMEIVTLPAVGLTRGRVLAFLSLCGRPAPQKYFNGATKHHTCSGAAFQAHCTKSSHKPISHAYHSPRWQN